MRAFFGTPCRIALLPNEIFNLYYFFTTVLISMAFKILMNKRKDYFICIVRSHIKQTIANRGDIKIVINGNVKP